MSRVSLVRPFADAPPRGDDASAAAAGVAEVACTHASIYGRATVASV